MLTNAWWLGENGEVTKYNLQFSSHTLVDWNSFCREVAIDVVMNNPQKIGGKGVIVELDESKFGKSIG